MMRTVLAAAVVALLGSSGLAAQKVRYGLGGGLLLPMGDYKTADNAGWLASGDVTYWLAAAKGASGSVGIRADVSYSQTSRKGGTGGNTKVAGGLAEVVYSLGRPADPTRVYLLGGVGLYNVKIDVTGFGSASETKVGFGAGAGVAFKAGTGSTRLFVEGRYTSVSTSGSSTSFIPIKAGVRFGA
jgi:opacity protein-like surface antigen